MCGIAGIVHWGEYPDPQIKIEKMVAKLHHRGPDDRGTWSCPQCIFGHTRLSILDLAGGKQPMANEDGTVVIIYNGEIYNHRELRKELEQLGHIFRTDHSDTEVLVHGYESWGEKLLYRLNGMFAFAIWDQKQKSLFLGRDRYGIKPLYVAYGAKNLLIFASEIRAILASGLVLKRDSVQRVIEYFSFQNLISNNTLFEGIQQFPAGHYEIFSYNGSKRNSYWDFTFPRSSHQNLKEAAAMHREILQRVIKRQTDADVPVMTYLSGGIDSSAVTASAFKLNRKIKSYSCIFNLNGVGEDKIVDEREFSREIAKHLGIERVEHELAQDSLKDCLDLTIASLECPIMGMSYENYLIAKRVSQDAKVVLSGTGGDEIHGGYLYRYQAIKQFPGSDSVIRILYNVIRGRRKRNGKEIYRAMLNFPISRQNLSSAFTPDFLATADDFSPFEMINSFFNTCPSINILDLVMYVDAKTYLHGLLVLEDKLSMAHSLETRVPLLDNELIDFVLNLPWSLLCDGETGKIIFRESVKPWVPPKIYTKPKMGFGPPDASWYRGELRSWIERELSSQKIKSRGVFQPSFVRQTLDDHFNNVRNNVALIWSLLSFESWCRVFDMFGGNLD